jgi:hypothetical protein
MCELRDVIQSPRSLLNADHLTVYLIAHKWNYISQTET